MEGVIKSDMRMVVVVPDEFYNHHSSVLHFQLRTTMTLLLLLMVSLLVVSQLVVSQLVVPQLVVSQLVIHLLMEQTVEVLLLILVRVGLVSHLFYINGVLIHGLMTREIGRAHV